MQTTAENVIAGKLPGRLIELEDGFLFPLTQPLVHRSSGQYTRQRRLAVLNRWIRKGILQVIGSPWLPGFWILSPEQSDRALVAIKKMRLPVKLLLSVSSASMNENKNWFSFKADPMMSVEVRWNSFESYTQEMKKKYRARLKKVMKSNMALEERILMPDEDDFSTAAQLLTTTLTE